MIFEKLFDIRDENDMSQKEIANILGVTQQNYSLWETGAKIIPVKHLNNFCNYFNVSMDYMANFSNVRYYSKSKQDIDMNIASKRLREIRLKNKLTQVKLANILNTSHSTISAYENAKTLLLIVFAYEISKEYDVSIDWLYGKI